MVKLGVEVAEIVVTETASLNESFTDFLSALAATLTGDPLKASSTLLKLVVYAKPKFFQTNRQVCGFNKF